jgi:CxxC-x17-CxxC domain-containing protein
MHKATCSSCGKECDLPFKPTGDRPVYCRDCFAKNGGNDRKEGLNRDDRGPRDFQRPSFNKSTPDVRPQPQQQYSSQLADISAKLDQLIRLMTPKEASKKAAPATQPEEVLVVEEAVPVKKAKVLKKKKASKKDAAIPATE